MQKKYPKVLIIGAVSINAKSATGITLSNLFSNWPAEYLAQLYDDKYEPDKNICGNSYKFSSTDYILVDRAKKIIHGFRGSAGSTGTSAEVASVESVSHGILKAIRDVLPVKIPDNLLKWVGDFNPDVIYSVLGGVRIMNIVLKIRKEFNIPVVPHFMDDWPGTLYKNSLLLKIPDIILKNKLKLIINQSAFRLTICGDMSDEYSERYGGVFSDFMNCVDIGEISARNNNDTVKFGFVGGMHLNRWSSLINVVEALQFHKNNGRHVAIEIYSPKKDIAAYRDIFAGYSVITVMDTLSAEEVNGKLGSLDVLVHVESFYKIDSIYTKLSVSTKIPQYMASGRPIVGYGPIELSSIKYITNTGSGLVVGVEDDFSGLKEISECLIESESMRRSLGNSGFIVANAKHNISKERERFRELLLSASDCK